jgi:hypothetical protein
MMALTLAFVGEMVPKAQTGCRGLLATMSATDGSRPLARRHADAADGWPALFYVNVPWVCWRWGWPIAICRPTGGAAPWRGCP